MQKKRRSGKTLSFKKLNKFFMGIIILLYLLSRMPPFFSQATNKTYIAEYGKIEAVVSAQGYVVRDEKVIKHLQEEEMTLLINEGERVRKGQKIATINFNALDDKTSRDLEIINLRVNSIKDQQSEHQLFEGDVKRIDNEINAVVREIQQHIKEEEYGKVYPLKENLSILVEKKSIISGEKSFSGKNLEQLERQQKSLQEKISASVEVIYSEVPCFVVLGSDGLEELLTTENLDEFTLEQYKTIDNISTTVPDKQQDQEVYLRIIENYKWSIITLLKEKDIQDLVEGKSIKIRQRGESKEYKAVVRKIIYTEGEDGIAVLDVTEFMEDWYNKRVIDFDTIKSSFEGIMIPNTAIVEKQDQQGVFRIDVNGYSEFIPIKIKGSNREYSIVYNGYFEKDDSSRVNTINYYDEVVANIEKINEGDRIR